jgi:hypothetical protein
VARVPLAGVLRATAVEDPSEVERVGGIVVKVLPISGRRFAGSTHSAHSCGTNSRSPALHAASQSVGAWQERPAS